MDRYDRAMLKLDALAQGRYESPTTYGKRVWKLFLQVDEDEESWVVRKFINGIWDEEFWRILRAERNCNKTMGLGIAMKRLKALYELADETDYDPDSDSEDESEPSAEESDSNTGFEEADIPISYFIVRTIPHHILADPVAFSQFLESRNSIPSFDRSGPFSRNAIEALQAVHCQQSLVAREEDSLATVEPPATATDAIYTIAMGNSIGCPLESTMESDMHSQFKRTVIPENFQLPPPDLWLELPFQHDSTVDDASTLENEPTAESTISEDELTLPCLWAELPFGDEFTAVDAGIAANKPLALNAQSGACEVAPRAPDCELGVSSIVDKQVKRYQNATGEKEVEKWKEKGWAWNEVDGRKGVAVRVAGGLDKEWVTVLTTPGDRERNARVDNRETREEPAHSDRPGDSDELAVAGAIHNPSVLPILTTSEWDPGPDKSQCTVPDMEESKARYASTPDEPQSVQWHGTEPDARDMNHIVVKTMSRKPAHPVAEFLWPPEDRINQAHHALIRSISTWNTCVRKHCLSSRRPSRRAAGIGTTSCGNGASISDNRRRFTQAAAKTRTRHSSQDTTAYALCIWKAGQALRGGINGKRIWDPGGGRAESLSTAGRRRARWAGWNVQERSELGELAGRQAFGF